MLPPGFRQKLLSFYSVSGHEKEDLYSPNRPQDQIVKYLANEGAVDINGLRRKFGYQAKDLIDDLMRDGCVSALTLTLITPGVATIMIELGSDNHGEIQHGGCQPN